MPDLATWPIPRLLSTAARLVEYKWNEHLATLGLTHAGAVVLEILAAEGEMTQAKLAQRVRVQPQTMGKTLVRLETTGYISRVRSLDDRRQQLVSISEQGQNVFREVVRAEQELLGEDGEMDQLKTQLVSIVRGLGNERFGITGLRPA
ncbi:MAG: MarR family winged helix-turn-helix transcriptional regulator [Actinomycetota bacterium]